MAMKEAVAKAKAHLTELYTQDELPVLALAEIAKETHEGKNVCAVTFGFFRQRNVRITQPSCTAPCASLTPPNPGPCVCAQT